MEGWATPSWTSQQAKSMIGSHGAAQPDVDFTEDVEINNL
jgi:hypothetical protein